MSSEPVVVSVAVFFLQQIPVESPAAEEALGSEYLPVEEWPQVAPIPPRRLEAAEAEGLPQGLHVFERLQPL